jgi:hypothetical protein
MNRRLISIGVALVDADARSDVIGWLIDLLDSAHRAYLPSPRVEVDGRRRTAMQFRIDSRELILVAVRPGVGGWLRVHPDGRWDRGALGGPASGDIMARLFEWLLDGHDPGPRPDSEAMTARSIRAGRPS